MGNIAHELISFADHSWPTLASCKGPVADGELEETNLYGSLDDTISYLHAYAQKHNLRQHISLNTEVISARSTEKTKWTLVTKNTLSDEESTTVWDAVVYAGGLWDRLYIPQIEGFEDLPKDRLLHARFYRSPSILAGKVGRC